MFGFVKDTYNILIKKPKPRDPNLPKSKPMLLAAFGYFRAVTFIKWFVAAFFAFLARQLFTSTVTPFTNFIFYRWNAAATNLAVGIGIPQV